MAVTCFVAYASLPAARAETIEKAVETIQGGGLVDMLAWKGLAIGGRPVISAICEEIKHRNLFVADVTDLNPNVLFELGYAIAHRKRIWLLLDPNIERAKLRFERFQLLTTIGYCRFSNSVEITNEFYKEAPYEKLEQDLYIRTPPVDNPCCQARGAALLEVRCAHGRLNRNRTEDFFRGNAFRY